MSIVGGVVSGGSSLGERRVGVALTSRRSLGILEPASFVHELLKARDVFTAAAAILLPLPLLCKRYRSFPERRVCSIAYRASEVGRGVYKLVERLSLTIYQQPHRMPRNAAES